MAELQLTADNLSSIAKQLVGPIVQQVKHELGLTSPVAAPVVKETAPVANTNVNVQTESDPLADAYDKQEVKLIGELSCPRLLTTRSKNGRSYTTNLTSQALQTLRDERKNRNQFRHQL